MKKAHGSKALVGSFVVGTLAGALLKGTAENMILDIAEFHSGKHGDECTCYGRNKSNKSKVMVHPPRYRCHLFK